MEMENIRVAKERGFTGIFTTNANRLTQHISKLLDYDILSSIQGRISMHLLNLNYRNFEIFPKF